MQLAAAQRRRQAVARHGQGDGGNERGAGVQRLSEIKQADRAGADIDRVFAIVAPGAARDEQLDQQMVDLAAAHVQRGAPVLHGGRAGTAADQAGAQVGAAHLGGEGLYAGFDLGIDVGAHQGAPDVGRVGRDAAVELRAELRRGGRGGEWIAAHASWFPDQSCCGVARPAATPGGKLPWRAARLAADLP